MSDVLKCQKVVKDIDDIIEWAKDEFREEAVIRFNEDKLTEHDIFKYTKDDLKFKFEKESFPIDGYDAEKKIKGGKDIKNSDYVMSRACGQVD